jgi:hypothetical protein
MAVNDFATTLRLATDRARRLQASVLGAGRRSVVLGALLLTASTVTVLATANTLPTITSLTLNRTVVDEGQPVILSGTFTDPDAADRHTLKIDWGGAEPTQRIELPAGQLSFQVSHTYSDDLVIDNTPLHRFRVIVADHQLPVGTPPNDNNTGSIGQVAGFVPSLQVKNVAPSLVNITVTKQPTRDLRTVLAVVVGDIIDPGADTHQVAALWGDEPRLPQPPTRTPCTVTGRRFRCEHTYTRGASDRTFTISLRVGDDDGGLGNATTSVQIPSSSIGTFTLSPKNARIDPGAPQTFELTWTVPDERVWRTLDTIELRLRKGRDTALWIRWDEASNSFCLVNDNGTCGQSGAPGSAQLLDSPIATLNLGATGVQGSGPTGQSVTLKVALSFKPQAAGETYTLDAGATDDDGRHDDFKHAGTLKIEGKHGKP